VLVLKLCRERNATKEKRRGKERGRGRGRAGKG
jgi:hypothetical protein